MSKIGSFILLASIFAVGLVTLYMAVFAASTPFALHMGLMAAWALAFIVFILARMQRPA